MDYLTIEFRYQQLFCNSEKDELMGLEEGIKNIKTQYKALEEIACFPQRQDFKVKLEEGITVLIYRVPVASAKETVNQSQNILNRFFALSPKYQPNAVHLHPPLKYQSEVNNLMEKMKVPSEIETLVSDEVYFMWRDSQNQPNSENDLS